MVQFKPATSLPKKQGSKDIVEAFIESDLPRAIIDTDGMGRTSNSIYVSLRSYLLNHLDLHITVEMQDGEITLSKE
jgi:hypothetical protein